MANLCIAATLNMIANLNTMEQRLRESDEREAERLRIARLKLEADAEVSNRLDAWWPNAPFVPFDTEGRD